MYSSAAALLANMEANVKEWKKSWQNENIFWNKPFSDDAPSSVKK